MEKITENSTLFEILKISGAEKVLAKYGLPCPWCPMARFELRHLSLGRVCRMYEIDLKKLLKELNRKLKNEEKS